MIQVRIRQSEDSTGGPILGMFPANKLDWIVQQVRDWGVSGIDNLEVVGQFVVDKPGAYFEIVVMDGGE